MRGIIKNRKDGLLVFYALAVCEEIFRRSHYIDFSWFSYVCYFALALSCGFAAIKIGLDLYQKKIKIKNISIIVAGFIYIFFLIFRGQIDAFMVLWIFIAASHDVDFNKLVKTAALSVLVTLIFVFFSSFVGVIDSTAVSRTRDEVVHIRNGLGFLEAYQPAYFTLFGGMAWIYYRGKKLSWYEWITLLSSAVFVFVQTDTRGPFYEEIALLLAVALLRIVPQFQKYQKYYSLIVIILPVVCALFIILQGIFLKPTDTEWLRELDIRLSHRLSLNYQALRKYDVSLTGSPIVWEIGEKVRGVQREYNWVDSVYLYSLLSYGMLFLVSYFIILACYAKRIGENRDVLLILVLSAIAVLGLWDNYCFRLECNPFYMFLAYEGTTACNVRQRN